MHPVDLPAVKDTDLTAASEQYLSTLESGLCNSEWFHSSDDTKVVITAKNVRRLQLFEDDQPDCLLLALHPPDDPTQVVALYLHEKWWCVVDVLRTSNKSRRGLMLVKSIMERVIMYLLSQVVERSSQVLFSLYPRTESGKLLWVDGQAVGLYTVKHKGSLCDSWSGSCYLLPVLDTIIVRRSYQRRGFGLQMLKDFCSSFSSEKFLGVSSPISPSMMAVFKRFLQQHTDHQEHLYEVEAPGGWPQRRNIWLNIQLGHRSPSKNEKRKQPIESAPRTDGGYSFQKTDRQTDLTSSNILNVNSPWAKSPSGQQRELCDHSERETSPSNKASGTGCSPAAYAEDQDPGAPTAPPQSLYIKQTLISKPPPSTDPHREEPEAEETPRKAKQVRRT